MGGKFLDAICALNELPMWLLGIFVVGVVATLLTIWLVLYLVSFGLVNRVTTGDWWV